MNSPRFSIVVPTLNRPDTLRHTLATLLAQPYADCEFVVQNNGHSQAVETLVEGLGDKRLRHFWTDTILPMSDNWEAALNNARGEFVSFLGDDDGFFPDACEIADRVLSLHDADLLSWHPYWYFWPAYHNADFRNRLIADVNFRFEIERVSSRAELIRLYDYRTNYSRLPMVYNSFVRREFLAEIQKKFGRYFFGLAPDVASGIINAARSDHFLRLSRPLSVTGTSQHSTGHNLFYASDRAVAERSLARDFRAPAHDPRLPSIRFLQPFLANDLLMIKDRFFPEDRSIKLNFAGLMQAMGSNINDHPELYDDIVDAIRRLGALHGIDVAQIAIPARTGRRAAPTGGPVLHGPARVQFVVDGNSLGLSGIDGAVRLANQIAPGMQSLNPVVNESREALPIVLEAGGSVAFSASSAGVDALVSGWGEPENWGTWSVAKVCAIRLQLGEDVRLPATADLACMAFTDPELPPITVECRVGTWSECWQFSTEPPPPQREVVIPADAVDSDGMVEIRFLIIEPHSPSELGSSSDTRLLGLGVKKLRLRLAG